MWKYLHLCVTVLASLLLAAGCTVLEVGPGGIARQHLREAEARLARKDYEGALTESREALSWTSDRRVRERALFNMAIVYSHEDSGHRDPKEAAEIFKKLLESDPPSPLARYAEMWISLQQTNTQLADENSALSNKNASLLDQNRELKQVLEKMKQVDIEIEQKRRN